MYVVDFGDGSLCYEKVIVFEGSRSGFIIYLYVVVGNYMVILFVFNWVGFNIFISF